MVSWSGSGEEVMTLYDVGMESWNYGGTAVNHLAKQSLNLAKRRVGGTVEGTSQFLGWKTYFLIFPAVWYAM
jgi:hypothetical protein